MRADHPTGAQDQMARGGQCQRGFAVAFGQPVDTLRVGGIGLAVSAWLGAVEDIVRRVMHNQRAKLSGGFA
jgi:hypothetical protein